MELRIRGDRAVLAGPGGPAAREIDPRSLAIDADLAESLHEWARVASAVRRENGESEAAAVISQRGRQLAARVAAVMNTSVRYLDPVTEVEIVVEPRPAERTEPAVSVTERLLGARATQDEPTPWLTGLTIAVFVGAVILVAMLALATTLAKETTGFLAIAASVVVTAGLTPSLWLARKLPIVRWVALGAGAGVAIAWIGVLVVSL